MNTPPRHALENIEHQDAIEIYKTLGFPLRVGMGLVDIFRAAASKQYALASRLAFQWAAIFLCVLNGHTPEKVLIKEAFGTNLQHSYTVYKCKRCNLVFFIEPVKLG